MMLLLTSLIGEDLFGLKNGTFVFPWKDLLSIGFKCTQQTYTSPFYLSCPQFYPTPTAVTVVELAVLEVEAQCSTKAFFLYIKKVKLNLLKASLSKAYVNDKLVQNSDAIDGSNLPNANVAPDFFLHRGNVLSFLQSNGFLVIWMQNDTTKSCVLHRTRLVY